MTTYWLTGQQGFPGALPDFDEISAKDHAKPIKMNVTMPVAMVDEDVTTATTARPSVESGYYEDEGNVKTRKQEENTSKNETEDTDTDVRNGMNNMETDQTEGINAGLRDDSDNMKVEQDRVNLGPQSKTDLGDIPRVVDPLTINMPPTKPKQAFI